jgi:hypothetical protein
MSVSNWPGRESGLFYFPKGGGYMKIVSSLVIGFLIGAALLHAKAASAPSTHILITPVGVTDLKSISADMTGTSVVGMSCVPKPMPKAPDAVVCYVATASN